MAGDYNYGYEERYVAALDVGTTTIRCQIIDSKAQVVGASSAKVKLLYPQAGYVEIDPDDLWSDVVQVLKESIASASLLPSDVDCLGLSTQRGTFMTWRKDDGKHFHNFITWKDLRAEALSKQWNKSFTMKAFRSVSYLVYFLSRSKRYLAGSSIKLVTTQTMMRLAWVLENVPELVLEMKRNNAMFGTVETWLVYKFTGGKTYVTDATNASATAFFDPFVHEWSSWAVNLFNLPNQIFPPIVNNDHDFGALDEHIVGAPIPIECVIADQSASMFGSCCFAANDMKVTLGTGSFLNLNTHQSVHGSLKGIYPVIGWKLSNEIVYLAEASCNDTGSLIEWALTAGLAKNAAETSEIASRTKHNDGVYFIPAFSGLGAPINDDSAASGFMGLKPTTKTEHMIRAILESIVFRLVLAFGVLKGETGNVPKKICVDGGVSQNNFVCQLLADMTGTDVERATFTEMSVLGVAFIAGLTSGIWKNKEALLKLREVDCLFHPTTDLSKREKYKDELKKWLNVVDRFKKWYKE